MPAAEAALPSQSVNALDLLFGSDGRAAAQAHDIDSARSVLDGAPLLTAPPPVTAAYVTPAAVPVAALLDPALAVTLDNTSSNGSAAAAEAPLVRLRIYVHVACRGDMKASPNGWAGERGSGFDLQGLAVTAMGGIDPDDLEYRALLDDGTLTGWHRDDAFCGTRGEHRPLRGIALRIVGPAAATHRVSYSAAFIDGAEVGPMADGELCAAANACALEAIKVVVYPHGDKPDPTRLDHRDPSASSENPKSGNFLA